MLLLWLLLTLPVAARAQYTFTTNGGTITITGYAGPGGSVTIPGKINCLPVTSLGDFAFYGQSSLTNVILPNSTRSIGFLTFGGCANLTNVFLGNGVTNIGNDAFQGCDSLTSFRVRTGNRAFSSLNGVLFNKCRTTLLLYPAGKTGACLIPNSVTNIADAAFRDCRKLTGVKLGKKVASLGQLAFAGCTNLAGINLSNHVTSIGWEAFRRCGLTNITLPNSVTNLGGLAFEGCARLERAVIGNGVKAISKSTFENCSKLSQLTIGNGVTYIGDYAFAACGMTSLAIPDSVLSISWFAFDRCVNLAQVTIPNSVTNLGGGLGLTFARCSSLQSIVIGSNVSDIGSATFLECTNLTAVYFQGNAPSHGDDVFAGAANVTVYYLPGTTGWGATFGGQPTAPWQLRLSLSESQVRSRGVAAPFGFDVNGPSGTTVVVEACTDLANPVWVPLSTNVLTGGSAYFSDPEWNNYPSRVYRAAMLPGGP